MLDATTIGEFEGIFVGILEGISDGANEVLGAFVEIVGIFVDLYSIEDGELELFGDFVLTGLGDFVEVGFGAGDFVDERTIDLAIIPESAISCT